MESLLEARDEGFDLALAVVRFDEAETNAELMLCFLDMRDRAGRLIAKIAGIANENRRPSPVGATSAPGRIGHDGEFQIGRQEAGREVDCNGNEEKAGRESENRPLARRLRRRIA
jgi:hypothetical protein